jgi:hypothetical protein
MNYFVPSCHPPFISLRLLPVSPVQFLISKNTFSEGAHNRINCSGPLSAKPYFFVGRYEGIGGFLYIVLKSFSHAKDKAAEANGDSNFINKQKGAQNFAPYASEKR